MHRTKHARMAAVLAAGLLGLSLAGSAFAAKSGQSGPQPAGHGKVINYIASVEGVTPAVLKQDLKQGKTLLQIAGSKYASADALATALLAPLKTRLDTAVKNHRLTASQETTLYARLHTRVAKLVVTPHPLRQLRSALKGGAAGGRLGHLKSKLFQTMATACGTTPAALRTAFQAGGKTPLAICQATKATVTQSSLVSALMSAIKTRIEARAKALGLSLSQAQEQQILAGIQTGLNVWVTTPIPAGGSHL
jgi:hypothetical protein